MPYLEMVVFNFFKPNTLMQRKQSKDLKMQLTTHQQKSFNDIVNVIEDNLFTFYKSKSLSERLLSLTGPAGTGKSVVTTKIVKYIVDKLRSQNSFTSESVVVTAPTHKATKVLRDLLISNNIQADCKTIHSFLKIEPLYNYEKGEEKFTVARGKQTPSTASLLIIDESSMIGHELFKLIMETVTTGRVNSILFIGDPFQLLPVDNNDDNEVFKLEKQFQLSEIVRQAKESSIITLATKIREMIDTGEFGDLNTLLKGSESHEIELFESREEFLKDFYKNEGWYKEDKIISSFSNKQVDTFNTDIRRQYWKEHGVDGPDYFLPNDILRFKSALIENGLFKDNNRTIYNNNEEVMIKTAKFFFNKDMSLKYWICTIVGRKNKDFIRIIDPDSELLFNKKLENLANLARNAKYPYNEQFWKDYYKLKNAFANVQYSFASTIHKLQGSTYDVAYADFASIINNKMLTNDEKFRLVYVAITRARSKVKILY